MAYVAYKTREPLEKELADTGMDALFREIEMPLVFTLADMEKEGIIASGEALKAVSYTHLSVRRRAARAFILRKS